LFTGATSSFGVVVMIVQLSSSSQLSMSPARPQFGFVSQVIAGLRQVDELLSRLRSE
jgi:hypothetical protein